ncbi:MAG TPA: DNA polymerase III subunit alpha [Thermomicrobiales bacterium]|nr:DNA polymerase III subunit alpha [Thermomicrobiales bacterium]
MPENPALATEFAHLHLHTEYSLLDGLGRIPEYINRAHEVGIQHVAVTDHGVMYASLEWYRQATKAGLHPIVGIEAYLAEGKASVRDRKSYHLLLLAENIQGYRNLLQLASKASLEGFYYRPRIDLEMLQQHKEGLIATSACLGGPVANNIIHEQIAKARDYAGTLAEIFGPERFFLEIQDHGIKEQKLANDHLIPMARELGVPLVATNDVHYVSPEDAPIQDLVVCVQTNTTLSDPKRLKSESDQLYFKSPQEMWDILKDAPEALSNTIRIAEMCDVDLSFRGYQLPDFDVPDGFTSDSYLEHLVRDGVKHLYGHDAGEVGDRLEYELGVIKSMGFTNYFLVVWDFIRYAREQDILVGPGRGSAAGSIVTYALGITALDPLKHGLIFERFLNPSRISMPDIDIDFADTGRDKVIRYVVDKYGDDRVAQIVTFGTLAAKASVRDIGKAMELPFPDIDRIAKLIPTGPGVTIDKAMERVPELQALYDSDMQARNVIDAARRVEGLARHASTHAAGVVISRDPLVQHVPLQRAGGKSEGDVTTQYQMGLLEDIGLLKMDFLGLSTLTILGKAVESAHAKDPSLTVDTIPLEDEEAFALLRRGDTVGIFQLEGGMTTKMTTDIQPRRFEDVVALMALIRPGPMTMAPEFFARKNGETECIYIHPELEPILAETYGITLYQEQVIQIANRLAGFSMAEGDGLRKAMGKKLPEEMAKMRKRFVDGCVENKIDKSIAAELFDMIERFAGYGFNKSHSAAYAVIAAQTAYMKAHYPVEFMAAVLSVDIGSTEKVVYDVSECRRAGIEVLPPDINRSVRDFSVEQTVDGREAVRFGLGAVRNVGDGAIQAILDARADQPGEMFASLDAVCSGVDWNAVSRRVFESLAKGGALDCFGERGAVLANLDRAISAGQTRHKAKARGQTSLFGAEEAATASVANLTLDGPPLGQRELLAFEKEAIGLYLSSHPLANVIRGRLPEGYAEIIRLPEIPTAQPVRVIASIRSVRRISTRQNKTMAAIEIEDLTDRIEAVLFPAVYEEFGTGLEADQIIEITGKVDRRNDQLQIIVDKINTDVTPIEPDVPSRRILLMLPKSDNYWQDVEVLQKLDAILNDHDGPDRVEFELTVGGRLVRVVNRKHRVEWDDDLAEELRAALGADRVRVSEPIAS